MRVSVTDRCNLRCRYCTPTARFVSLSHTEIITYEEIERLARILAPRGVSSIRITGGEPLVRRHLDRLIRSLCRIPGLRDISLTTNGVLLAPLARPLRRAGLSRVNVSLDSLRADRFSWITDPSGRNGSVGPDAILRGLEEARLAGMDPIKINVVLMRGFNDDELEVFAALTRDREYEVRFIEFMPLSPQGFWGKEKVVAAAEVISRLQALNGTLEPLGRGKGSGPAVRYRIPGHSGTLGFITPISEHFCVHCNRIRVTADGKLRTCLFSDRETDLIQPLRSGASDTEIFRLIEAALKEKPDGHGIEEGGTIRTCARTMSHIGG
ncbi:MAG: GTP 3',8-cyclase MoaA [bacterium]|nr:MAG: GTP 3',8-cyclase MoaA [bacterium]